MKKHEKKRVIEIVDKAQDRFIAVKEERFGCDGEVIEGDENLQRVRIWMAMFIAACCVIEDTIYYPHPPKFSKRQIALLASGLTYLFVDARRAMPLPIGSPKCDGIYRLLGKVWDLHMPFLYKVIGIGHPNDETKKRYGIT